MSYIENTRKYDAFVLEQGLTEKLEAEDGLNVRMFYDTDLGVKGYIDDIKLMKRICSLPDEEVLLTVDIECSPLNDEYSIEKEELFAEKVGKVYQFQADLHLWFVTAKIDDELVKEGAPPFVRIIAQKDEKGYFAEVNGEWIEINREDCFE